MMEPDAIQSSDEHLGALQYEHPTAREAQRTHARVGEYLCEACRTNFDYAGDGPLGCPNCSNSSADSLTPLYIEDDPSRDELLSPNEFPAGD